MTIRFLQTSPSASPEYPFQAGQVITVPRLTREMARALETGSAIVLTETPETASVSASSRAVKPRGKARVI